MSYLATVLYEDKMRVGAGGEFPPHDLLLSMVADRLGRTPWSLRDQIRPVPCNGVNKLIGLLPGVDRLSKGGRVCILVDRDKIAERLGLSKGAPEPEVVAKLVEMTDAPGKLSVHFLDNNIEDLMRSIEECAPSAPRPKEKDPNARDIYLKKAAFALSATVRDCVQTKQASLGTLAALLAELCRSGSA